MNRLRVAGVASQMEQCWCPAAMAQCFPVGHHGWASPPQIPASGQLLAVDPVDVAAETHGIIDFNFLFYCLPFSMVCPSVPLVLTFSDCKATQRLLLSPSVCCMVCLWCNPSPNTDCQQDVWPAQRNCLIRSWNLDRYLTQNCNIGDRNWEPDTARIAKL